MRSGSRRYVLAVLASLVAGYAATAPSIAQDAVAGWRVECTSDGKVLECRAIQQMINREDKQLVAQLTARIAPDTKAPALTIQLPLGISLTEPVQLKVDNGAVERLPVQTCTNAGCIVNVPLKRAFAGVAAKRHDAQDRAPGHQQAHDQHRRAAAWFRPRLRQGDQVKKHRACVIGSRLIRG